jgi:hypothetical protein
MVMALDIAETHVLQGLSVNHAGKAQQPPMNYALGH